MAQILKKEIKKRIYYAAIEEFINRNYHLVKMKDIAERAGVPTGLIYTYFENKKDLFKTIIDPVFQRIKKFLDNKENTKIKGFGSLIKENELNFMQQLFHERKQLLILIDKSEGTEFEYAKEDLILLLEKHISENLRGRIKNVDKHHLGFFYHVLAAAFLERMFEAFRHFDNFQEIKKMIKLISQQHFYGIQYFIE
jgi:AcrR family transcriptional regulator